MADFREKRKWGKKIRKQVVIKQFKMKKKKRKTYVQNQGVFLEPCIEINSCKRIRGSGATDVSISMGGNSYLERYSKPGQRIDSNVCMVRMNAVRWGCVCTQLCESGISHALTGHHEAPYPKNGSTVSWKDLWIQGLGANFSCQLKTEVSSGRHHHQD